MPKSRPGICSFRWLSASYLPRATTLSETVEQGMVDGGVGHTMQALGDIVTISKCGKKVGKCLNIPGKILTLRSDLKNRLETGLKSDKLETTI